MSNFYLALSTLGLCAALVLLLVALAAFRARTYRKRILRLFPSYDFQLRLPEIERLLAAPKECLGYVSWVGMNWALKRLTKEGTLRRFISGFGSKACPKFQRAGPQCTAK